MKARYPGTCWFCSEPFPVGENISNWGEEYDPVKKRRRTTWGHQKCSQDYARKMEALKPSASTASGRRRVLTRHGWVLR